ncbi:hypothetical protein NX779_00315 [Mycoplasma cottewii]|uniref:Uncharacterized protein n=1 Tax=Mycoplasma cottewii TaxID=51364 RepID=A0ABY5TWN0_9MOLU|nr:hypothetical protein [Mycoplasma cottewii]UWD35090.1 hypothetical protein NX779_00315 [Mycoplasma cottewii]
MKLTTWTFYKASSFQTLTGDNQKIRSVPVLVLRPDFVKERTVLCLALTQKAVNSIIIDLQNKAIQGQELLEIFKDNIGFASTDNLEKIDAKGLDLSTPILDENIKNLIETYNLFLTSEPIEFDSADYETTEKAQQQKDVFTNVEVDKMKLPVLLETLNVGMENYKQRVEEFSKLKESKIPAKKDELFNLQGNLIVFFDQALREMDALIAKLSERNSELYKELQELKGEDKK